MHIPDGILNPVVLATTGMMSAGILAKSVKETKQTLEQKAVPFMGVMAAFIFAAQMVNFPLLGAAASGHFVGGSLAAIIFGFWPATLIMTTVVSIQAIVFQDGGITAIGANILNMAIIAPAVALLVYKGMKAFKFIPSSAILFFSAFASVLATSLGAAFQLGFSDVVSYKFAIQSLLFWHFFIGIGEGIITVMVMPFLKRSSFTTFKRTV